MFMEKTTVYGKNNNNKNKKPNQKQNTKEKKRNKPNDTQGLVYQINLISSSHAQLFK